ncbi:hypothetical protein NDU88_002264 [Pleurodeles waltl]|uniref:Uncharacterized protein n=1 Tax=Pleurodeles waltl TaxID=8319 RepID=A0AAV7MWW1_PLEWA|nr:hypothetical protein NDU88_002264 [Pleurodeles waltl]
MLTHRDRLAGEAWGSRPGSELRLRPETGCMGPTAPLKDLDYIVYPAGGLGALVRAARLARCGVPRSGGVLVHQGVTLFMAGDRYSGGDGESVLCPSSPGLVCVTYVLQGAQNRGRLQLLEQDLAQLEQDHYNAAASRTLGQIHSKLLEFQDMAIAVQHLGKYANAQMYGEGERPSSVLANLIRPHREQNVIITVQAADGSEIRDPEHIN